MTNQPQLFNESYKKIYPFLRWAGGKSWLINNFRSITPTNFKNYHEPFIGGASMFLFLRSTGRIQNEFFLSDLNAELINCYLQIKRNVDGVIDYLANYKNTKTLYYKVRAQKPENKIEAAARFIFLNRTSFNGIYRVNLRGEYNVPFGFKNYRVLFDYPNLREISKLLRSGKIFCADFEDTLQFVRRNDFIFLDPPYTVAHNNNGFIKYNQKIFSLTDQHRLAKFIEAIKHRDAYFILTNAEHFNIKEIFADNTCTTISRFSVIGGKNAKRGRVNELIFSNINT